MSLTFLPAFLPGFSLGFSLILAIGAQNAFVLRQGVRHEHVFWVCLTCAVSDAVLITAGVYGFGALVAAADWIEPVMRYGGAVFLFWYGALSFSRSLTSQSALVVAGEGATSLAQTLATVLAFTWLNPHVYLDTVVLLGSVASQYPDRVGFGLGAVTSSFVFFFGLGYGARLLAPVFARPQAWQILNGLIGLIMWAIAIKLLVM